MRYTSASGWFRMRTTATALVVLAVCTADHAVAVERAKDSTLVLTARKQPAIYNIGELIEVDAIFSTKLQGYCFADSDGSVRMWKHGADEFRVVPARGAESVSGAVNDPFFDEMEFVPVMSSELSSFPRPAKQPLSIHFSLNEWVRIAAPGRYRVAARSSRLFRCPPAEQSPPRSIQSNEIEITILPVDDNWAASQLQEIRGILHLSSDGGARYLAARRLSYLNTPDSTRELAAQFVSSDASDEGVLSRGVLESSWHDIAISELDRSLRSRDKRVPQSIYQTLAMLLVAREYQNQPPLGLNAPSDPGRMIAQRDRFISIVKELHSVRPETP